MAPWTGRRSRNASCFLFYCPPRTRKVRATAQRRRAAPVVAAPPPVRREFVAFDVSADERAAITRQRFSVVAEGPLTTRPGRILRLSAPEGMGQRTALRRLAEAAPGAVLARNDRYRSFLRPAAQQRRAAPGRMLSAAVGCAAGATVAMIDTAVDPAHPALSGADVNMLALRAPDRQPSASRHGTAVASMLIGREGSPAPGLAPAARLVAIDAFHRDSAGLDATDAFDLVRALDLLASQQAAVINLSLTGPDNAVLARMIATLIDAGRLIVAAAGNDGPRARPLYPAAYPGVIAVTAVDEAGQPWRRAARGDHIAFAALGVDLALAGRNGGAEAYTGTSFAAPTVSAMIAAKSLKDTATPLRERLAALAQDRGDPGRDAVYGYGIVQPADACR
ncbi:MAG: S8 family serine peptidase [Beijerinckiaceae bacterium]|jgi:subtilisin family serine protease|nr:S8 family serine peptidase [Beijerinckiaceae bacterium]